MSAPQVYTDLNATADDDLAVAADPTLVLLGYVVSETAASPAVAEVLIIHGADGDGDVVAPVFCAASATHQFAFPEGGIPCPNGLTIERIAGETSVALYYRTG